MLTSKQAVDFTFLVINDSFGFLLRQMMMIQPFGEIKHEFPWFSINQIWANCGILKGKREIVWRKFGSIEGCNWYQGKQTGRKKFLGNFDWDSFFYFLFYPFKIFFFFFNCLILYGVHSFFPNIFCTLFSTYTRV